MLGVRNAVLLAGGWCRVWPLTWRAMRRFGGRAIQGHDLCIPKPNPKPKPKPRPNPNPNPNV